MKFKVGDIVGWINWADEPEIRGKVIEVDHEYNSVTAAYTTKSGRSMYMMAHASTYRFIMGSVQ